MTDTTTHTDAPDRFMYAPEGMTRVEGYDRHPGHWANGEDQADKSKVRYPVPP